MSSPIVRTASRTGTTADAPTVKPGGCHGYLLSTDTVIGYRLYTSVFTRRSGLRRNESRNTIQLKRCSKDLFFHRLRKAEREKLTMDDNIYQYAEGLVPSPPVIN
jgi:hypothetical protein